MYGNSLLDKLDRKFGRYALRNLMTIIVVGTGLVWLLDYVVFMRTGTSVVWWLMFDKQAILQGQVWRLITFIFVPEESGLLFLALTLYFYWLIGNSLENEWGSLRFDLYYLVGILGAIGSGFLTGYATNYYLHMSLFLAFALINPDYQILLFYFLPIKMKFLAIIDLIGLGLMFIFSGWVQRIALLVALLNIAIFFWRETYYKLRALIRRKKYQRDGEIKVKPFKPKKNKKDNDDPFEL